MDIETQIAFIRSEKQRYIDGIASLQAIEDTLSAKIAPIVASLQPLTDRVAELEPLEPENVALKARIKVLEGDNPKVDSGKAVADPIS
jgi:hypothetical protein